MQTTISIIMKDIYNVATQINSGDNSVSTVKNMIETNRPDYSYTLVQGENTVEALFIQDSAMKSNFSKFLEVVLTDSTYK